MTKTEARRLAQRGRQIYGHYRIDAQTDEYPCPLCAGRDERPAHGVTVWHHVWDTPTAGQIDAAIVEHLTSRDDDERCPLVRKDAR